MTVAVLMVVTVVMAAIKGWVLLLAGMTFMGAILRAERLGSGDERHSTFFPNRSTRRARSTQTKNRIEEQLHRTGPSFALFACFCLIPDKPTAQIASLHNYVSSRVASVPPARLLILAALCAFHAITLGTTLQLALAADENTDLELIPREITEPSESREAPQSGLDSELKPEADDVTTGHYKIRVFLDEALQTNFERGSLVAPLPNGSSSNWSNRISLDLRAEITLTTSLSLTLADRLNYFFTDEMDLSADGIQNDLKEAYLTWDIPGGPGSHYLDLGRVNVKNGVATGFNPTDYFKKNAITVRISEDPGILRENRLGTFIARTQGIWERGALTLAIAPEVSHGHERWWTDGTGDLGLDRTNARARFLAKVNVNDYQDLSPELLYFYERGRSNCGLNLTRGIGDQIVTYAEWSIGERRDITGEALHDAKDEGIIPRDAPRPIPGSDEIRFCNQLAVGFSYTEKMNRTTHFEYQYNEAGFSQDDWNHWLDAGSRARRLLDDPTAAAAGRGMLGQLWTIRQWAQNAQEPLSRHSFLVRSQWRHRQSRPDPGAPILGGSAGAVRLIHLICLIPRRTLPKRPFDSSDSSVCFFNLIPLFYSDPSVPCGTTVARF